MYTSLKIYCRTALFFERRNLSDIKIVFSPPFMSKPFSLVAAITAYGRGMGNKGGLPWPRIPGDMAFFQKVTSTAQEGNQNAVIMGRKTWDSISQKFRPLRGRVNVVLTSQAEVRAILKKQGVYAVGSLDEAFALFSDPLRIPNVEQLFIIGGAEVYKAALQSPLCSKVFLTQIFMEFEHDTKFPSIDESVFELEEVGEVVIENSIPYQMTTYVRKEEKKEKEEPAGKQEPSFLDD